MKGLSRITAYHCGIPRCLLLKRKMMMLAGFFDESGNNRALDPVLVIAGLVASVAEWERASDAWYACLRQDPAIEYFKWDEANGCKGQFWKFGKPKAQAKIFSLARVIASFDLIPYCSSVDYKSFSNAPEVRLVKVMGTLPYHWGFINIVRRVLSDAEEQNIRGKVDLFFDKKGEMKECHRYFESLREDESMAYMRFAGVCEEKDDKDVVALQMADLLAGESFKHLTTELGSEAIDIIEEKHPISYSPADMPPDFESMKLAEKLISVVRSEYRKLAIQHWKHSDDSPEIRKKAAAMVYLRNWIEDVYLKEMTSQWGMKEVYQEFLEHRQHDLDKMKERGLKREKASE